MIQQAFINRMEEELAELDDRMAKLKKFLETDTYKGLPTMERQLLNIQVSTMSVYGATLYTRLDLVKARLEGRPDETN